MLVNIIAEMARRQMTKREMAKKLDMHELTFEKKLQNKDSAFTINQIVAMKKIFNDENITLEYLIAE